jgi:predicted tellurium resistance membrane protein TerC
MLADVTMSLDNVLAVGALAAGNIPLLVAGLILSMVLLFVASTLIARLMDRFKWLLDVAAVILGWTTANLILQDPAVATLMGLKSQPNLALAIHFAFVALVLLIDLFLRAFLVHRVWLRRGTTAADARESISVPTARPTADRPPSARPKEAASRNQSGASAPMS